MKIILIKYINWKVETKKSYLNWIKSYFFQSPFQDNFKIIL